MNIFLLHEDPDECAKALCDKHINKMCIEAVQIANTGLNEVGLSDHSFYGSTHTGQPWCEFVGKSFDHFQFVVRHAQALGREFLRRYDSRHTSHDKLRQNWRYDDMRAIEREMGRADPMQVHADLPQTMPDEYKDSDVVKAYRQYYVNEKLTEEWCVYEYTNPPEWFVEESTITRWYNQKN